MINFNKSFCIIVTLLVLFQTGCFENKNEKATTIAMSGDRLLEKGDVEKAIKKYNEAIKINTKNSQLYRHRAFAYFLNGDLDQSIYDSKIALSFDQNNPDILASIGISFFVKKDFNSAIYYFSKAIDLKDNDPLILTNRGTVYAKMVECKKAINDYKRAMNFATENNRPTIKRHIAWIYSTCPDTTIRDGVKALDMAKLEGVKDETHFEYKIIAAAYAETGDFKKAVTNIELAIDLLKKSKADYVEIKRQNTEDLADYLEQLEKYKNKKPWRLIIQ